MHTKTSNTVVAITPSFLPKRSMRKPNSNIPITSPIRMELESWVFTDAVK